MSSFLVQRFLRRGLSGARTRCRLHRGNSGDVSKRYLTATTAKTTAVEADLKVAFLGSGNWGSAAAWLASQNCLRHDTFADDINMFVYEETVHGASTEEVNEAWKVVAKHISDDRGLDNVGIQLLAAEVGVALSRAEAKAAIREMDLNDDSRVTYDEFIAWWNSSGKSNVGRLLSSVINREHENKQYLPGVKLGSNVHAHGNMETAVADADLLVFVTPHQFVKEQARQLREQGAIKEGAIAISLIKGMEITPTGFELISQVINRELGGVETSVLMGANIASEVADGKFSEATVGAVNDRHARLWKQLFHTDTFHVETTCDLPAVEMCGTLKNVVALGAGFCDGMDAGNNTKAAIMRVGFAEMQRLIRKAYPETRAETFMESCGVADLITTCYGGRNRKCAEAFVRGGGRRSFDDIEEELLDGQKLQGVLTSNEAMELIRNWEAQEEFPLFTTINRIVNGEIPAKALVRFAELPSFDDFREEKAKKIARARSRPMRVAH